MDSQQRTALYRLQTENRAARSAFLKSISASTSKLDPMWITTTASGDGPARVACPPQPSVFYNVLTAIYTPNAPVAQSEPQRRANPSPPAPPRAGGKSTSSYDMIQWVRSVDPELVDSSDEEDNAGGSMNTDDIPSGLLHEPLYTPFGRWAWAAGQSIVDPRVILELGAGAMCTATLKQGRIGGHMTTYISRCWSLKKRLGWRGFYSELALYKSRLYLRPLQGDVVPSLIGVHIDGISVSLAMEPPHHSFWIEASPDMPLALKDRVLAAFDKLHQRGILHGDAELRHMLIGGDGGVTLIDFQESRALRPIANLQLQQATKEDFEMEIRKVMFKLDYCGSRQYEVEKMSRASKREKRNSDRWAKRRGRIVGIYDGPIEEYEPIDVEDDIIVPVVPFNVWEAQWAPSANEPPRRTVVPGQTPEQVEAAVRHFMAIVAQMEAERIRYDEALADHLDESEDDMMEDGDYVMDGEDDVVMDEAAPLNSNPRKRRNSELSDSLEQHSKRRRRNAMIPPTDPATTPSSGAALGREFTITKCTTAVMCEIDGELLPASSSSHNPPQPPKARDFAVSPPRLPLTENPYPRASSSISELSSDQARLPIASSSPSDVPQPVKTRDFVDEPYDGPRGYYVPHPPTEIRMGIERVIYIRENNRAECTDLDLRYHTRDLNDCAPPDFKRHLPRGKHVAKGELKRRKERLDDPGAHEKPAWKRKLLLPYGEDRELNLLMSSEYLDIKADRAILTEDQVKARPGPSSSTSSRPRQARSSRPRSILRKRPPIKPISHRHIDWAEESDLCLSPKLGPPPLPIPRSETRAILGSYMTDEFFSAPVHADDVEDEPTPVGFLEATDEGHSSLAPLATHDPARKLAFATLGISTHEFPSTSAASDRASSGSGASSRSSGSRNAVGGGATFEVPSLASAPRMSKPGPLKRRPRPEWATMIKIYDEDAAPLTVRELPQKEAGKKTYAAPKGPKSLLQSIMSWWS